MEAMEALFERAADNLFSIMILVTWVFLERREKIAVQTQCKTWIEKLIGR